MLSWFSKGVPEAQGSIRPLPKHGKRLRDARFHEMILTSDNRDLKQWRAIVRSDAVNARILAHGNEGLRGIEFPDAAIRLTLIFVLPRPLRCPTWCAKDDWSTGRRVPGRTRPDVDKLSRGVLDALTGIVYTDDGQVADLVAQKVVAAAGEPAGLAIGCEVMTDAP